MDIQALTKQDIGRYVRYKPSVGSEETGRIKSWNKKWIFVVYKCDNNWNHFRDYTGCATKPEDLTFED